MPAQLSKHRPDHKLYSLASTTDKKMHPLRERYIDMYTCNFCPTKQTYFKQGIPISEWKCSACFYLPQTPEFGHKKVYARFTREYRFQNVRENVYLIFSSTLEWNVAHAQFFWQRLSIQWGIGFEIGDSSDSFSIKELKVDEYVRPRQKGLASYKNW